MERLVVEYVGLDGLSEFMERVVVGVDEGLFQWLGGV